MNGNGRIGRFLPNAMIASGSCYPWTVIPLEQREVYVRALKKVNVEVDIGLFAEVILIFQPKLLLHFIKAFIPVKFMNDMNLPVDTVVP